jgi:stage II sporulation protein D
MFLKICCSEKNKLFVVIPLRIFENKKGGKNMLIRKKLFQIIILLSLLMFLFVSCEQQGNVKGVKERGKLEAEPEIRVKLATGEEKTMKLEEYISGVVAGEMKANWPLNAYAAQAIIARTFALKYMEENKTNLISGDFERAQEYKPENITDKILKAVKNTRGEVALYKDEYIKAWFHSSAAGQTTSAKVGLAYEKEEPPYIKSVKSPDQDAPDDIKNWSVKFTKDEIETALEKMGKNIDDLKDIKIVNKDNTGRVIDFKFTGSKDSEQVKAANFRKELDSEKLKSTKISDLKNNNDEYIFTGSGFGHGVGVSQWGAYNMGKDGKSPEDIVLYFFNGIEIVKVYD